MLLSLLTTGVSILNASAFLLMAAGPELLDFIVCSSVFSIASWLYSFMIPAAFAYDIAKISTVRLLQAIIVAIASAITWFIRPSDVAMTFIAIMVIDAFVFPAYILLYRSQSALYIRGEMARGIAGSLSLAIVIMFLDGNAAAYVNFLAVNCVVAGVVLAVAGVHRPPPLSMAQIRTLRYAMPSQLLTSQARAILISRILDVSALTLLSRFDLLAAVLSLKMGMAVSTALSLNSRERTLTVLLAGHVMVYGAVSIVAIGLARIEWLPVPPTLAVLEPLSAAAMVPLLLTSFIFLVHGLRRGPSDAPVPTS